MTPTGVPRHPGTNAKRPHPRRTSAWRTPWACRIVQTMAGLGHSEAVGRGRQAASLLLALSPLHVRYARDELLCREGTFVAGLQLITEGIVLETSGDATPRGGSRAAELLGPGDAIGLEVTLSVPEELSFSSYRALTEVHLLFVDRPALDEALRSDARLAVTLIGSLSARHFRLRDALARSSLPPTSRLRSALLDAASVCGATAAEETLAALPPEIDLRVLGDLARLSPTQVRRGIQELTGVQAQNGQIALSV